MRIGLGLGLTRGGKVEPTPGPANTVAPAISGTAEVGETLTCSSGTWTGNGTITYAYQWRRDGVNIGSATASTYTLVVADDSTTVDCVVTATDLDGSKTAAAVGVSVTTPAGTPPELTAFSFDTSTQPDTLDGITVSGTWTTIRWQVDGTASYASPAAMDLTTGSADASGSFTSLPATIDLTGVADGSTYYLHMYAENGSGKQTGAPVSQAITVDNTAATLSSVTGTPSGMNITWGVTSNSGQGTIYAAARLSSNGVLSTSEIRNGTGNAVATSSDATPTADANNGGTLSLASAGTYVVDCYQDDGFGNLSAVASSSSIVVAAYAQNIVQSVGGANLRFESTEFPAVSSATAAVWVSDINNEVSSFVIDINPGIQLGWDFSGNPQVRVRDSANTLLYSRTWAAAPISTTSGALTHWQVDVDLSIPQVWVYLDGVDVTSSFGTAISSGGTGTIGQGGGRVPGSVCDVELCDLFVSYGSIVSNATLYNGGTPPNPVGIGSPQILLGGSMDATDWNAFTNLGSATVNTGSSATGFVDVP